jgi:hypothetical protein
VDAQSQREARLQRLVSIYVVTGLVFMLLPGTFLGVWNLISISSQHSLSSLSASWLQAHGHAQIFGWIGTFIIGIGYFSLSKVGQVLPFAVSRGWLSWGLWTSGLTLRWMGNVNLWHWRVLLPASAGFELAAFLIFFLTVSRHRRGGERASMETWMKLVIASTIGFLILLLFNLGTSAYLALRAESPAFPHWLDQRFLVLATWGLSSADSLGVQRALATGVSRFEAAFEQRFDGGPVDLCHCGALRTLRVSSHRNRAIDYCVIEGDHGAPRLRTIAAAGKNARHPS